MSYDIAVVERDFAMKCREGKVDLGEVLEKDIDSVPDFGEKALSAIENYLLTMDLQGYLVETKTSNSTIFRHKENESIQVTLTSKVCYFKAGSSGINSILDTTAGLTIESDVNAMRFDFQDGLWG